LYNISANTIFTGKYLIYLSTCHSTNDYAAQLLSDGQPAEGTLIITPEQTAGKGQRGNKWEAEAGKNLTFSLILKPGFLSLSDQFYLNMISSLAVRDTAAEFLQTSLKVKWPNDIYLNDKKIAGILIQNSIQKNSLSATIIGIGLNVNQTVFSDKKAFSLQNYSGKEHPVEHVLEVLLEKLEANYLQLRAGKREALAERYKNHLFRLNEKHFFRTSGKTFEGIITGVDESGRLIIRSGEELLSFGFKEVEFVYD